MATIPGVTLSADGHSVIVSPDAVNRALQSRRLLPPSDTTEPPVPVAEVPQSPTPVGTTDEEAKQGAT